MHYFVGVLSNSKYYGINERKRWKRPTNPSRSTRWVSVKRSFRAFVTATRLCPARFFASPQAKYCLSVLPRGTLGVEVSLDAVDQNPAPAFCFSLSASSSCSSQRPQLPLAKRPHLHNEVARWLCAPVVCSTPKWSLSHSPSG